MKSNEIVGRDGLHGEIMGPMPADGRSRVTVRLDDGQVLEIPASLLARHHDGGYEIPLGMGDLGRPWKETVEQQVRNVDEAVVPVLAEELDVQKRAVPTGAVRVHRRVLEHEEDIEMPLVREHLDIRRVIFNEDVDGPLPVRQEGDTIIVPIVEEVLLVQKRYRLKEEVHMTRRAFEEVHRERVLVRRQEAEIERVGASGESLGVVENTAPNGDRRTPRESLLGE